MDLNEMIYSADKKLSEFIPYYIDKIARKYKVTINIQDYSGVFYSDYSYYISLAEYLYHNNPFCILAKSGSCGDQRCVEKKRKLSAMLTTKRDAFYGRCYMGLGEIVFPFYHKEKLLGYICAGEFSSDPAETREYIKARALEYGLDHEGLLRHFDNIFIDPADIDMEGLIREVKALCFLLRNQYQESMTTRAHYGGTDSIVQGTIHTINREYYRRIPLQELADAAYCTPGYLCRLFKKRTGMGLTDYIKQVRIKRACYYLHATDLSLTQIAQECGFNQASYFTKVFKKYMNMTPSEYRHNPIK